MNVVNENITYDFDRLKEHKNKRVIPSDELWAIAHRGENQA